METVYQYQIKNNNLLDFKVGQRVFLVSNPEAPKMTVVGFFKNKVVTKWINNIGHTVFEYFPPFALLQYEYAALVRFKNYNFHLN